MMTPKEQKIKEAFEKEFEGKGYNKDDVLFFGANWQLDQIRQLRKEFQNNMIFGDKFDELLNKTK